MSSRFAPPVFAAAALAWVAILVATPLALGHGYVTLPAIMYEACSLICHQRAERSFHLGGLQLPVCARCFGLYASGALGAIAACMVAARDVARGRGEAVRTVLALAAIPTAVTLGCEWAGLWAPGGVARAIAAVPLGGVAGWLLARGLAGLSGASRAPGQLRYHS